MINILLVVHRGGGGNSKTEVAFASSKLFSSFYDLRFFCFYALDFETWFSTENEFVKLKRLRVFHRVYQPDSWCPRSVRCTPKLV